MLQNSIQRPGSSILSTRPSSFGYSNGKDTLPMLRCTPSFSPKEAFATKTGARAQPGNSHPLSAPGPTLQSTPLSLAHQLGRSGSNTSRRFAPSPVSAAGRHLNPAPSWLTLSRSSANYRQDLQMFRQRALRSANQRARLLRLFIGLFQARLSPPAAMLETQLSSGQCVTSPPSV